jgi:uncharacterized membrane protein
MSGQINHGAATYSGAESVAMPINYAALPVAAPTRSNLNLLYWLHLGGLLTGITPVVALVMAYTNRKKDGDAIADSHYTFVIRTFWIGALYAVIGFVTTLVLIGLVILPLVGVWWIVRCAIGISRASRGEAIAKPKTWFW